MQTYSKKAFYTKGLLRYKAIAIRKNKNKIKMTKNRPIHSFKILILIA